MKPIQALALAAAVLGSAAAAAAEQVEFVDGRTMVVESLRLEGEYFVLVLDSSASVAVPRNRIARVQRYVPVVQEPEEEPDAPLPWTRVAGEYADMIRTVAAEYELDPAVITAMIQVESNFDPYAVSHKGACGLLQLIPATAERFGVKDVFDPKDNLAGGARYFRWLLDRFDNRMEFALAAYNAGENVVERYDGIPPYRETRDYVARVLRKVESNGGSIKSRPES